MHRLLPLPVPKTSCENARNCRESGRRKRLLTRFLILPIVMGILASLVSIRAARGDDFQLDPDQIMAALHTNSEIAGGFIDRTVGMVKAGTLPRDLFTSSFIWARKKPRHRFEYFKQALTARAAELGIKL